MDLSEKKVRRTRKVFSAEEETAGASERIKHWWERKEFQKRRNG